MAVAIERHTNRRTLVVFYAAGLRAGSARLVRGSSRRMTTMRFRPAYIRVINRRNSRSIATDVACLRLGGDTKITEKGLTGRSISEDWPSPIGWSKSSRYERTLLPRIESVTTDPLLIRPIATEKIAASTIVLNSPRSRDFRNDDRAVAPGGLSSVPSFGTLSSRESNFHTDLVGLARKTIGPVGPARSGECMPTHGVSSGQMPAAPRVPQSTVRPPSAKTSPNRRLATCSLAFLPTWPHAVQREYTQRENLMTPPLIRGSNLVRTEIDLMSPSGVHRPVAFSGSLRQSCPLGPQRRHTDSYRAQTQPHISRGTLSSCICPPAGAG